MFFARVVIPVTSGCTDPGYYQAAPEGWERIGTETMNKTTYKTTAEFYALNRSAMIYVCVAAFAVWTLVLTFIAAI